MGTSPREHKVMHAVGCPRCGAAVHEPCVLTTERERATARGRLLLHMVRRRAWQEWRRTHRPDVYAEPLCGSHVRLRPTTDAARAAIAEVGEPDPEVPGARLVLDPDAREAIDALTESGLHVE